MAPTFVSETRPPIPASVFRVGVTGHRPSRLTLVEPAVLAARIREVLEAAAAAARSAAEDTQLVLVTSLAEGVDRIAAKIGLELHFALQVPLPMPVELYVSDFKGAESVHEFQTLLAAAERTFVLPAPEGNDRNSCYAAASNVVVNQSDLLLVVSDDGPSGGPGGATDTQRLAEDRDLPTVRVAALPDAEISFNRHGEPLKALRSAVWRILRPYDTLRGQLDLYREERWPSRHPAAAYAMLRLIAERRLAMPPRPRLDEPVSQIQSPSLRSYFKWADTLAMFYGERSRTASLRLQVLATLSVIAGLLNTAFSMHPMATRGLSSAEAGFLLWLLWSVRRSHKYAWHTRWLRYRSLAEQLRCVDLLAPLGLSSIQPNPDSEEHPSATALMPWLVRRVEAEQGLPAADVDRTFLNTHLHHLNIMLQDQSGFHAAAARRYRGAEQTFHRAGMVLFWTAAVLALYDLLHGWIPGPFSAFMALHPWLDPSFSTLAVALPALGSAAVGIVAQGEYKRLAENSAYMQSSLCGLVKFLTSQSKECSLRSVSSGCLTAARILSGEVRGWSDLLASRSPSLPV